MKAALPGATERGGEGRGLRVAVLSYPMLTQVQGGLEVQIVETIAALRALGCDIRLIDPLREKLAAFDLVHVFALNGGNHQMVAFARLAERPVVVSPLVRPYWTAALGRRARLVDRLMGRLTGWQVATEYRDCEVALERADHVVALGAAEKQSIVAAFRTPADRISVVPNGIPPRFFGARPEPFAERFGLAPGFVLCVASIDEHKNQLGLARALAASRQQLVLIGECNGPNRAYLDQVLALPHVSHLGSLRYDDPLLASAYAAAGVFALASASEVMPLVVLEALAAGTPVVMTRHHGMDTAPLREVLIEVEPRDESAIAAAVERQFARGPRREACAAAVEHLTWRAAGQSLLSVYDRVLRARSAAAAA